MAKLSMEPTDLDATMGSKLQRKKALVLGAAGGMGRATALELSRRGVTVCLAGRDIMKLDDVCRHCHDAGGKAIPVTIDVARVDDLGDAVANAIDLLGGLNFLVNCAGRHHSAKAY